MPCWRALSRSARGVPGLGIMGYVVNMRTCLLLLPMLSLALALACGGAGPSDGDADLNDTARGDSDVATDGVDTGARAGDTWGVGGTLDVLADTLVLESSALLLQARPDACDAGATLLSAVPADVVDGDDVGLIRAWTVSVARDPEASCNPAGPRTFRLGVGPVDDALLPAAARRGLSVPTSNGLYLQDGDGPLWLVGLVGTAAQLDGSGASVTAAPLPDGTYQLVTLFGVPVDR